MLAQAKGQELPRILHARISRSDSDSDSDDSDDDVPRGKARAKASYVTSARAAQEPLPADRDWDLPPELDKVRLLGLVFIAQTFVALQQTAAPIAERPLEPDTAQDGSMRKSHCLLTGTGTCLQSWTR